jgi:glycosyl transferase family 25
MLKIFLINLQKRTDRLNFISSQLNELGLNFEKITAIDGMTLPLSYPIVNYQKFLINQKRPIVQGEIGCAESHRFIWKKMLNENIDYALALEDDVEISPEIIELIEKENWKNYDFINISEHKPYNTTEILLNQLRQLQLTIRPFPFQKGRNLWKTMENSNKYHIYKIDILNKSNAICECNRAPILASGYIISKKAANAYLKTSNQLYYPIDWVWHYSGALLKTAFLSKPLITQILNDTNIYNRKGGSVLTNYQIIKRFFLRTHYSARKLAVWRMYRLRNF